MLSPVRGARLILELKKGMIGNQGKYSAIGAFGRVAGRKIGRVNQNTRDLSFRAKR
jgi:hypothetical protein